MASRKQVRHPHEGPCTLEFCGHDRCPHCSFDPTNMNDYCDAHQPTDPRDPAQPEGEWSPANALRGASSHGEVLALLREVWDHYTNPAGEAMASMIFAALHGQTGSVTQQAKFKSLAERVRALSESRVAPTS